MKKSVISATILAAATMVSTASHAQSIPLNILVSGTTGTETVHGQTAGALTTTSTVATSTASTAASMIVSGATTTTTN